MLKPKAIDEIQAAWTDLKRPKDGQTFMHYKGGLYQIVATGFMEDNLAPCIIYKSKANNTVWVRTAENFLENVRYNGKSMPRFNSV